MPTIEQIRTEIKKSRKNGISYRKLAKIYLVEAPTIRRIERGEKLGTKTLNILSVDPSKKLECTRIRIAKKNKIAQYWGYKSWSDYETQMIRDFDENFDPETNTWKET
jgi:hypothetical protein